MSDPITLLAQIDTDLEALDRISHELDQALEQFHAADELYTEAFDEELALLYEECERDGKRLPGEDVRRALIHTRPQITELARNRRRLERRAQRLQQLGRSHEKTLSGRQSELAWLKAEGYAPQQRGPVNPVTYGKRAA